LMMSDPAEQQNNPGDAINSTSPKFAEEKYAAADWGSKILATGVGLPAGFLGTKYLYDSYTDSQGEQKVDSAKKKYLAKLRSIQEETAKQASETPCVDGFCEVLAEQLNKEAFEPTTVEPSGLVPNWRSMAGNPKLFPEGHKSINSTYTGAAWHKVDQAQRYFGDPAGHIGETAKVLAALGLTSTLGGLIYANSKKREKEQKLMYPNRVSFA